MPAAELLLRLPLLLFLLFHLRPISCESNYAALRRVVSDLNGQLPVSRPCNTPGVTCEPAVTRIVMESRRLNGFLSPSIGHLPDLRQLSLPDNRLTGAIPFQIAGCVALEILNLRNNSLSGEVPGEISSLASLRILDLSHNRLSGDLDFLNRLPALEKLSLAGNLFSGRIPKSLSSFKHLVFLDLSGNRDLSGNPPRPAAEFALRRRLLRIAASAPAPAPSAEPTRVRSTRRHVRNWIIGFAVGSMAGVITGVILSILFRTAMNCIRGRYKNPAAPTIFSPLIKRAEHLAFLEKEDGVAALEIIGRGGCGEVFKAQLGEKSIAIKKIARRNTNTTDPTKEEGKVLDKWQRQIRSEILTVGRIRHRNLVPLLAHIPRPDCDYLVYDYLKNGSLHDAIVERRGLDWPRRHLIATGIAAGLEYLHHQQRPHIVHRDLKPANVLLDDEMEAKISDFGLAKELPDANTHATSSNVAGTVGYIAPEYYQTLKVTSKCDVYSLGVILAVLVLGMLPSDDFFQNTEEMSLVRWLRNTMSSTNPTVGIDAELLGKGHDEQMLLVLKIACFCTADDPKDRPTSKDVRCMLSQIKH